MKLNPYLTYEREVNINCLIYATKYHLLFITTTPRIANLNMEFSFELVACKLILQVNTNMKEVLNTKPHSYGED